MCTRISKLQKKVIRFLTNSKFNTHTAPLFKQLGLLKAVDIFKLACFKLLYKYENRKLPSYFNGMFVLQNGNLYNNTGLYASWSLPSGVLRS